MKTVALTLFSPFSLLTTLFIAFIYILFTVYVLNYHLFLNTVLGAYALQYKAVILFSLIQGIFTSMSIHSIILLFINSLLVGINLTLVVKTIRVLEDMGGVKVSVGGATLLGLISTGCSSCGLSILSVIGLSASLSFLPFHGLEIQLLATAVLLFSTWYMMRKLLQSGQCKLI